MKIGASNAGTIRALLCVRSVGLRCFAVALALTFVSATATAASTAANTIGCRVTPGSDDLLIVGTILAPEGPIDGGILISADRVLSVGGAALVSAPNHHATRIECRGGVISPGLINAHDHLDYDYHVPAIQAGARYENRSQWLDGLDGHRPIVIARARDTARVLWPELRQVMAGTTTIAGSGGRHGLLRNVDVPALREGLVGPAVRSVVFPLGDYGRKRRNGCPYVTRKDLRSAANSQLILHVGEGTDAAARDELLCLTGRKGDGGSNLVDMHSSFVHAIQLDPSEVRVMAEHGTSLIWSPRSNIALYGSTTAVTMADRLGLNIALSTDWTPTGSMNLLRELGCARYLNEVSFARHFSARDLWRMVTVNAARALGFEGSIGSLRAGSMADLAVYDGSGAPDPYSAVIDAGPKDVLLVLRGGLPLYGQTGVVEALPRGADGCEPLLDSGVCGAPRTVCLRRETGVSVRHLFEGNRGSYPLFFCGTPQDEPSCIPPA